MIDTRGSFLVSNESLKDYRAIVADLDYIPGQPVTLDAAMCTALKVTEGSPVRLVAL
ncbi:Arginine N-succinyltransferase subunit alpha [compost metagenome]